MAACLELESLQRWLLVEGTGFGSTEDFLSSYAEALRDRGLPVERMMIGSLVVHPQAAAYGIYWNHGSDTVEVAERSRDSFEKMRYPNNPVDRTNGRAEALHLRLDADVANDPALGGLRNDGFTDFIGIELRFGGDFQGAVTWATRDPDGFSDEDAATLFAAQPALSAIVRPYISSMCQQTLLRTYLGRRAGDRVHRGEVRRGDGISTRTAIWFSDLRGFTQLSATLKQEELLDLLNQVFERIVSTVNAHGGEVLKFMGDGVLAIFPSQDDERDEGAAACQRAREAAGKTQKQMSELGESRQANGHSPTAIGIGLHYGDVMYGNIGAQSRLDFTVIGPAVNIAARIEGMCSKLEQGILMSRSFAQLEAGPVESLGAHALKGVGDSVEIVF
jgi:adenylate cyclase